MKYTFADFIVSEATPVPHYYRTACRYCGAPGPSVSNVNDSVQAEFHQMVGMVTHMPNCALIKAAESAR